MNIQTQIKKYLLKITVYQVPSHREPVLLQNIRLVVHSDFEQNQPGQKADGSQRWQGNLRIRHNILCHVYFRGSSHENRRDGYAHQVHLRCASFSYSIEPVSASTNIALSQVISGACGHETEVSVDTSLDITELLAAVVPLDIT